MFCKQSLENKTNEEKKDMLEICIGVTVISAILALAHIAARFLPDSLMDRLMKILRSYSGALQTRSIRP